MIIAQVVTLVMLLAQVSPGNRQICWHGCPGHLASLMGIWFAREWLAQVVNPSLPVPSIAWQWLDGWKIGEKVS